MATQDNGKLIRDFYSALDRKDYNQVLSYFAPNAEFHVLSMDKPFKGNKEIRESFDGWFKAFPDAKTEVLNMISSGDTVAVEVISRATHGGELVCPQMGTIAPTHRKIQVPASEFFKISNGKIVSWRSYWLGEVMMKQLGIEHGKAQAA